MKMNFEDQKYTQIKDLAEKNNLDLIMVFGSQIKGTANKESDIDIGIYRVSGLNLDDKINLSNSFAKIFETDKLDINIISSNSPLLMREILVEGKILYQKEKKIVDKLKLYAWKLLAESKPFRDKSFALLKDRIALL